MSSFEIVNTNITDTLNAQAGIGNPAYVYLVPESYSTIKSAIETAFANGHDEYDPAIIRIFPDTTAYNEDLTLYSGIYLESVSEGQQSTINGTITFGEVSGVFILRNLILTNSTTVIDDSDGTLTGGQIILDNVNIIANGGNSACIDIRGSDGELILKNSNLLMLQNTTFAVLNVENGIDALITNSVINDSEVAVHNKNSQVTIRNSTIHGRMVIEENSTTLSIERCNCSVVSSTTVNAWITVVNSASLIIKSVVFLNNDSTITSFFTNLDSVGGSVTNTGILNISGLTLEPVSENFSTFRAIPNTTATEFNPSNTKWSDGHIFTISTAPTNATAVTAGLLVNCLYRSTNASPDPSPIYIRSA